MADEDRYSRMAQLSGTAQSDTETAKVNAPKEEGLMRRLVREWVSKKSVNAAPKTWREVDEETGGWKYYRTGANGQKEEVAERGI